MWPAHWVTWLGAELRIKGALWPRNKEARRAARAEVGGTATAFRRRTGTKGQGKGSGEGGRREEGALLQPRKQPGSRVHYLCVRSAEQRSSQARLSRPKGKSRGPGEELRGGGRKTLTWMSSQAAPASSPCLHRHQAPPPSPSPAWVLGGAKNLTRPLSLLPRPVLPLCQVHPRCAPHPVLTPASPGDTPKLSGGHLPQGCRPPPRNLQSGAAPGFPAARGQGTASPVCPPLPRCATGEEPGWAGLRGRGGASSPRLFLLPGDSQLRFQSSSGCSNP